MTCDEMSFVGIGRMGCIRRNDISEFNVWFASVNINFCYCVNVFDNIFGRTSLKKYTKDKDEK